MAKINITSPVGRIVMGSLYDPCTTDAEGKPLVVKTGHNAGQPRVNYFFALAIQKGDEPHWAHTPWGHQIWAVGNQAHPNAAQSPAFAWKIEDGDSQIPNKKCRKPCDNEGWKGHWILKFSGGFAPKVYQHEGTGYIQITQKDFCKPGYFVEVAFNVDGNGSTSQPGIYLNHSMVCFRAYGQEIDFGPDVSSAGFGQSALPVGASMIPPAGGGSMPPAGGIPMPPAGGGSMPPAGGIPMPPAGGIPMPPAGGIPMPPAGGGSIDFSRLNPVTPNPTFAQVRAPAPPIRIRQMTSAANGISYSEYIAAGWNDVQLVSSGMMLE